jgi:hypothetical protein
MTRQNNEIRELNEAELDLVTGGSSVATVAHDAGLAAAQAPVAGSVQLYLRRAGGQGGIAG